MLPNFRVTDFTVSELLRENQLWEGVKLPLSPSPPSPPCSPRLGLRNLTEAKLVNVN